jgi:hypothetical protein
VLELLLLLLRAIALACRGHEDVVLENIARRHQLRTLQRSVKRPRLRTADRVFWVLFASAWRSWRSALVLVQPDTVLHWHRDWLRRHWARRSGRNRAGRRALGQELRTLVADMASATPLAVLRQLHLAYVCCAQNVTRSGVRGSYILAVGRRRTRAKRSDGIVANHRIRRSTSTRRYSTAPHVMPPIESDPNWPELARRPVFRRR